VECRRPCGRIIAIQVADVTLAAEVRSSLRTARGTDHWDPKVYLIGLKPGTTRAVYCNRMGEQLDFSKSLDSGFQQRSFQIIVQ
jgi:hypothetical protein